MSASQSQTGAEAPSRTSKLPKPDFGFNDLREQMAQFTLRFDAFIERGRQRVLDERDAFRRSVAELEESAKQRKQEIAQLESQSSAHAATVARETAETEEMHSAIRSLQQRKEKLQRQNEQLRNNIAQLQAQVKTQKEMRQAQQRALDAQAKHNGPELSFWEQSLALRMEATGIENRLRFVFWKVDRTDRWKECSFDLDMGGRLYEIVDTKPTIERDSLDEAQDQLNETRDLTVFLGRMRNLFKNTLKR
ncbi:hypothetical protein K470DRAFT_212058 [Piedraia hortae CBS 480.64]|uniref:Kinetochore protein SPC25 n=1 Tax=Piedraia hortae CBS 480.64 TaxID=1314780 RepID=A0A6A7C5K7_9PEZI|nr:hypothetical protein K470DRAFT_212058 [Piedraia hortae CBS 480.64]